MEETAVVIVGAGPSGLCLAAALAFHKIKVHQTSLETPLEKRAWQKRLIAAAVYHPREEQ